METLKSHCAYVITDHFPLTSLALDSYRHTRAVVLTGPIIFRPPFASALFSSLQDLYTFDQDVPSSISTYNSISAAYSRIFSRLSLPVYRVVGSPGKIGGSLSHEFQLPSPAGEDAIIVCENCKNGVNEELLKDEEEREAWSCGCEQPKVSD